MLNENDLRSNLKELVAKIIYLIDEQLNQGLSYRISQQFQWIINDFEYTEQGSKYSGAQGNYIQKKDWTDARLTLQKLLENDQDIKVYKEKIDIKPEYINMFIDKIVSLYLYNSTVNINELVEAFIRDLNNEPCKCGAIVELKGVIIKPERVEFKVSDLDIVIRQVTGVALNWIPVVKHSVPAITEDN
jgi:hypothetical protein